MKNQKPNLLGISFPVLVTAALLGASTTTMAFNTAVYAGSAVATTVHQMENSSDQKRDEFLVACVGKQMDRQYDINGGNLSFAFNQQQTENIKECVNQRLHAQTQNTKLGQRIGIVGLIFGGSMLFGTCLARSRI